MDTPRYRIGNDLTILWAISNRDGSPYNLEGKEVRLFVTNERGREEVDVILSTLPDGSVNNVIRWDFKGEDQRTLGGHTLTVEIQTAEDHREIKKDFCEAFVLVGSSCAECIDDGDANIMDGGELILSSRLDIYMFGGVGQGLVSKIYNEDDFGSVFNKGSKIDTFNAHAINTLYEKLRDLKIGDVTDIAISNPKSDNLLVFNGHSWVNVTAKSLFDKYGTGSSGGSGSGSGSSGDSFWYMGDDGKVHIDYDIYVAGNATMEGDTSAGGEGSASVGIQGIIVNGVTYRDTDGDGIIDLGEITGGGGAITEITSAMITSALGYTPYDASNPNGYITASALGGYATQSWVEGKGYAVASSLGSLATKDSLLASDIPSLDWNKITSGKPTTLAGYGITDAYTTSSIDSKLSGYLRLSGGIMTGTLTLEGASVFLGNERPLYFKDNAGANRNGLYISAGNNMWLGYDNRTDIKACIAGSEVRLYYGGVSNIGILLSTSGNVGIGTSSPAYKLDVAGTGNFSGAMTVGGTSTLNGALTVNAGATINGNLVVTGDISA